MKISGEIANVINIIKKDEQQKKSEAEKNIDAGYVEDIVTVENRQASANRVENVEQARDLLNDVTKNLEDYSSAGLYNINSERLAGLIS